MHTCRRKNCAGLWRFSGRACCKEKLLVEPQVQNRISSSGALTPTSFKERICVIGWKVGKSSMYFGTVPTAADHGSIDRDPAIATIHCGMGTMSDQVRCLRCSSAAARYLNNETRLHEDNGHAWTLSAGLDQVSKKKFRCSRTSLLLSLLDTDSCSSSLVPGAGLWLLLCAPPKDRWFA